MHRHSYSGRKLSLATDQRRLLVRGLVTALVLYESIQTTEAKAKEIAPAMERLVTKAKRATLADRRALLGQLSTENAVNKLIHELAPAMADRQGGYTRIVKLPARRGDNAKMARISLVLPAKVVSAEAPKVAATATKTKASAKPKAKAKAGTAKGGDNA